MVFAIDVRDDDVLVWSRDGEGVEYDRVTSYTPTIYVSASYEPLSWLAERLEGDPKVHERRWVDRRVSLRDRDGTTVLEVALERPSEVTTLAREIRTVHEPEEWAPGTFRLFNVDIKPRFRYCLETGTDPTPTERLRTVSLTLSERALSNENIAALRIENQRAGDSATDALESVAGTLADVDPDVLVLSRADLSERRDVITFWRENEEDRRLIKHALELYSDDESAREYMTDVADRATS